MSSRKTGRRIVTLKLVYYVRSFIIHAVCKSKREPAAAIVLVLSRKQTCKKSKRAMHYLCLSSHLRTKRLLQPKIVNRSFSANTHHN